MLIAFSIVVLLELFLLDCLIAFAKGINEGLADNES